MTAKRRRALAEQETSNANFYRLPEPTPPPPPRSSRAIRFKAPGRPQANHGNSVRFVYIDSQGEVTEREVRNWVKTRQYLEGFCIQRGAVRTFRIDQVEEWLGHE